MECNLCDDKQYEYCKREHCLTGPDPEMCWACWVLFQTEGTMGQDHSDLKVAAELMVEKVSIEDGRVKITKHPAPDHGYRDTPVAAELRWMEQKLKDYHASCMLYEEQLKREKRSAKIAWRVAHVAVWTIIALAVLVCMLIAAGYGGGR
jgi:hypothetical protein